LQQHQSAQPAFKAPAPRPPRRLLADRKDLPDALRQCKRKFKLKHPPSYYKALEHAGIKPKPGYTWEQVELDRTLRTFKQYYLLPEFKKQAEETRASTATTAKALIKTANETCATWEDFFKAFLLLHKSQSHVNDATKVYNKIGYHSGLFHTLYLL